VECERQEVGGSLKPMSSRPAWATKWEPHLKNKKKKEKRIYNSPALAVLCRAQFWNISLLFCLAQSIASHFQAYELIQVI
jgi:hypothetical protein